MNTQQQTETQTTTIETYGKQTEGRIKWSRSADFAWGGGASILTALLLWLLFGVSPANVATPVVTAPTAGAVVAANEPVVVAGNAAPNQSISVVGNGEPLGDTTAGSDGRFSYELTGLEPGEYSIVAQAVDDAGQEVAISEPVTITVTGPRVAAQVTLLPDDQMPVVDLPDDGLTFDENATRTISGEGVPGSLITILNGATPLAQTTVDADGRWALELPALAPGAYDLTLQQRLPDGQEVTLPGPLTALFAGLAAPQLVLPVEGLRFTPGRPITLEGTGAPGATVTVNDAAGNVLGSAPVDASGAWALTLPALNAGDYQWNVKQTTPEDQVVSMAEPLAFTVGEPSSATTAEPTALPAGAATAIPADAQPVVISPAEGAPLPAGQPITLEGAGAPGATITVTDAAGKPLGKALVDALGAWTLTLPAPAEGAHAWNLTQTTADGVETAPSAPLALTVGEPSAATPDAATAIPADAQPVVVSPAPGVSLPAGQPITLEGTGAPGATITVTDAAGKPLGKALVDALGAWTLTLPAPAEGAHAWNLTQTTADGVETAPSAPLALTVGEPSAATPDAATAIPADAQPVVVSPAPGVSLPAGQPITLEGTGAPGATITVSDAAGDVMVAAPVAASGAWKLTLPAQPAGKYTWNVKQTTADGVETAPSAPVALTISEPSGAAAAPSPTAADGVQPTVTTTGAQPTVTSPAEGASLPAGQPITLVGTGAPGATILVSDTAGKPLGKAIVDSSGAWTLTLPAPEAGDHVWTVVQINTDAVETALPRPLALTIIPPEFMLPEVTKPGTDLNAVTGATLTLEGIGQPGAAIAISEGATVLAETAVGPTGVWQAAITGLAPGLHSLKLAQTTESGVKTEAALPITVTVVAEIATASAPGGAAPPTVAAPAQIWRGAAPAGASVSVYAGDALLGTVKANKRGEWRLTLPAGLSFKPGELTIKAHDTSGAPLGIGKAGLILDAPLTLPVTGGRRR